MIKVQHVNELHRETVIRWHQQKIDNSYDGLLGTICQQHAFNFQLWHQEDIARSPAVDDARIAQVKRNIDRLNQLRNDWIEKIDDEITDHLAQRRVAPAASAGLNTETPGSAVDRLSILALRIYHLEEQTQRGEAGEAHVESVTQKLAICLLQQQDLSSSLRQLIDDILAGRKRHRTYRQMKMYNDPTLNPYLYQAQQRLAG